MPKHAEKSFYQTPICILGAGPAGLTASLYLSKFEIEHVVVDKRTFPRDKICGECFDGRVGRILEDLNPDWPKEMAFHNITSETRRYTLHFSGEEMSVKFPDHNRPKLLSRRLDFDRFLYEKANASPYSTILTGIAINDIEKQPQEVVLYGEQVSIQAQLAIVASGAQARFGQQASSDERAMIYGRRYYQNLSPEHGEKEVELYYFQQPLRGCLVICPLPDGSSNVEIGFTRVAYKACGYTLEEIMEAYIEQQPTLLERFAKAKPIDKLKGTFLPLPRRLGHCAEDRLLRAGAEVYSFNPLTGAGVGNAMVMGQLAARTAQKCVAQSNYSYDLTQGYERAVRRRLRGMIRFNRTVNILLRNIHLIEWILPVFMRLRFIQKLLSRSDFVKRIFQWYPGSPKSAKS